MISGMAGFSCLNHIVRVSPFFSSLTHSPLFWYNFYPASPLLVAKMGPRATSCHLVSSSRKGVTSSQSVLEMSLVLISLNLLGAHTDVWITMVLPFSRVSFEWLVNYLWFEIAFTFQHQVGWPEGMLDRYCNRLDLEIRLHVLFPFIKGEHFGSREIT